MRWLFAGATALGTAHAAAALPCQDSVAWWTSDGNEHGSILAVAALADGAGSARLAEIGSRTAVAQVVRQAKIMAGLVQPPDDGRPEQPADAEPAALPVSGAPGDPLSLASALFAGARSAIQSAAHEHDAHISDLATTLAIALVTTQEVVVGQVGDGVIAVRLRSGDILGPAGPQRGEFSNETSFITAGPELPEISLASFATEQVDAFGISSDGMRLLITANPVLGTPHAPFFDDVFDGVASGVDSEAVARFLDQADDRTGDDKSLIIGVRAR